MDLDRLRRSSQEELIELNKGLYADLTRAMESYVSLMARCDQVQRDKIDMQFELQRFKQSTEATLIMREKKIKMLEESM